MTVKPKTLLVDAVKLNVDANVLPIIKGDATSYNIASASILAKVARDRIMREWDKVYPEYGFEKHKGYGTKVHMQAIQKYGVSEVHRKSFMTDKVLGKTK